jgi:hypothetical protein
MIMTRFDSHPFASSPRVDSALASAFTSVALVLAAFLSLVSFAAI